MSTLRFRPLGQVFSVGGRLPEGFVGFAQSPQALVLPDRVRVYFASRTADGRGRFVSHPLYADFTRDLSELLDVADRPVLSPGELGCFDEHGIFPFSPVPVGDEVWAYTCGWSRRVAVPVETATGLAISRDGGRTFARIGPGPVFGPSPHEPFLVGDSFVVADVGTFHMWYMFGTSWARPAADAAPERTYKIGHVTSPDGVHWPPGTGCQIVPDRLGASESQALPTVIRVGGRWHMVFCYRESVDFRTHPDRGYQLGYAWSDDLVEWHRDDAALDLPRGAWDDAMRCYPNLFTVDGRLYLLYNGNEFGRHGFGAAVLEDAP